MGLLYLLIGVIGVIVSYVFKLGVLFDVGVGLLIIAIVIVSRFSEAKVHFKKSDKWFSHTPGVSGRLYPAYTPRTWQGWSIFTLYFVSFVLLPAGLSSILPLKTYMDFLFVLVASMTLTTVVYLYIANKTS